MLVWLSRVRESEGFADFELVLAEGAERPTAEGQAAAHGDWVRYLHLPMPGTFHKAALLNRAVASARGDYLIPFDVDLLPADGVLARHLSLAVESPRCLVAGYRVQLPGMPEAAPLPTAGTILGGLDVADESLLCNEDAPLSLRENLVEGQRFGVCPCFPSGLVRGLGGHIEDYLGWGCEDQDLIERACASGLTLVRAYDLLYFHLPHEYESDWRDPALVAANRRRFAERRRANFPKPAP
jgi:hypothetical protein